MDILPIIAGLITVVSALLFLVSLLAYRGTRMVRMLSVAGISFIVLLKGILLFMDIADILRFTYEAWAGLDLIMVVLLALMLFGKE